MSGVQIGPGATALTRIPLTASISARPAVKFEICPDLRGFGKSFQPQDSPDSHASSKREKAMDCLELMRILGYHTFSVAGHDRGSYVAFRLAMDHPLAVKRLAVIDSIPIIDHLERMDWRFARDWYHWFFFSQELKPEAAINANPLGWYAIKPGLMGEEAYDDVVSALTNPVVIHGMVEDYRAGLTVDWKHDVEDRKHGRKIQCPLLCLWSRFDDLVDHFGDPLPIWRSWANDVEGHPLDSGHHVAEENPQALATSLRRFFA
ncbi:alpha/beta hydrolase [Rhizobium sp. IBUN]|uniref:alpha/beta fold hydrolase n=1 Tax=Rhizobium sp. IBUN TaxID=1042326 RepID=UPI0009FCD1B7